MPAAQGDTSLTMESAQEAILRSVLSDPASDTERAPKEEKAKTPPAPAVETETPPAESEDAEESTAEAPVDEEQDTAEEEEAPKPKLHKVKVDNEELEVTEDELLKGYSRQADYTKKTSKLAEERKVLEQERTTKLAEIQTQRTEYEQRLTAVHDALQALTPAEPDWEALRARLGPAEFAAEHSAFKIQQDRLGKIKAERDRIRSENDAALETQAKARLATEREKLLSVIPEWKDPEKERAGKAEVAAHLKGMGFTDEDLTSVTDHRHMDIIRKAMLYDRLMAAKPKVEEKVAKAIADSLPGNKSERKPTSDATKARQRLAQTGRREDAQAAIMHLL